MAAVPKPIFTETFNIQKAGQPEYRTFIEKLRDNLGKLSNKKSHNLPVLPDQEKIPTKWIDIILQNNKNREVKVRIRVENLYLDGYQTKNSKTGAFDKWFELQHQPKMILIPGAVTLHFNQSYDDLLDTAKIKKLESVLIGKQEAVKGIDSLDDVTTKDSEIAEVLIVFIQMFCEAVRFTLISDYLGPTFILNGQSRKLDTRMVEIEKNWGTLSEALLKMDTNPNYKFPPQPKIEIYTYLDAVEILGLLLGGKAKATVLVTFVVADTATVKKVYGLIESHYEDLGGAGSITSVLFRKEANELVDVTPGQVITLSESELDNVPFVSSHVVLKSELRAENNQVIAHGHAEFPVQLSGASEKVIPCEHGEICVKVTWI